MLYQHACHGQHGLFSHIRGISSIHYIIGIYKTTIRTTNMGKITMEHIPCFDHGTCVMFSIFNHAGVALLGSQWKVAAWTPSISPGSVSDILWIKDDALSLGVGSGVPVSSTNSFLKLGVVYFGFTTLLKFMFCLERSRVGNFASQFQADFDLETFFATWAAIKKNSRPHWGWPENRSTYPLVMSK